MQNDSGQRPGFGRARDQGAPSRDPFMNMRGPRVKVHAGKVIAMLRHMMDSSEALSLVVGDRGGSFVIGYVGGNRREMIYLHSGENQIVLNEEWIDSVEERDGKIVIRGDFAGRSMTFKPYYRNRTPGIEAAERAGGDAGWLIGVIEAMKTRCEPHELIWVTTKEWEGKLRKLQWMEFDEGRGEVVLVTGRLDMLRKVRLKAETLGDAISDEDGVDVLAAWGDTVEIFIDDNNADQRPAEKTNEEATESR